jgi:AAHS family 4-hydroxybenzoate transporter-like MFS transporter
VNPAPDGRTVDVSAILDGARLRGLPGRVFVLASLALIVDGFDIAALAFIAPSLIADWNVSRAELAPVLAAALIGMSIGSLTLGRLGDRYGRRTLLVACLLLAAAATLGCATAHGPVELAAWRFVAGLGLGGSLPNASSVTAEFAPARWRSLLLGAAIVGLPLGSVIGAEISARVIPLHGWAAIFVIGAALPAALAVLIMIALPESPRFLARQPARRGDLERLLTRVGAGPWRGDERFVIVEPDADATRGRLTDLWSDVFRRDTLGIWLAFGAGLFAVYALGTWIPTLLSAAGLPLPAAIRGSLWFNFGGMLGSVVITFATSRFGSRPVLITTVAIGIVGLLMLAVIPVGAATLLPIYVVLAVIGASLTGSQSGLYPLATNIYPTALRASGVGWALGAGRVGGVLSSFAASAVAALGGGLPSFCIALAAILALMYVGVARVRRHVPGSAAAARTVA